MRSLVYWQDVDMLSLQVPADQSQSLEEVDWNCTMGAAMLMRLRAGLKIERKYHKSTLPSTIYH